MLPGEFSELLFSFVSRQIYLIQDVAASGNCFCFTAFGLIITAFPEVSIPSSFLRKLRRLGLIQIMRFQP